MTSRCPLRNSPYVSWTGWQTSRRFRFWDISPASLPFPASFSPSLHNSRPANSKPLFHQDPAQIPVNEPLNHHVRHSEHQPRQLCQPVSLPTSGPHCLVNFSNLVSPAPRKRSASSRPRAAKQATAEASPAWIPTSRYALFFLQHKPLQDTTNEMVSVKLLPRAARRRPAASSPAVSGPARQAARAVPAPAQVPPKRMLSDDEGEEWCTRLRECLGHSVYDQVNNELMNLTLPIRSTNVCFFLDMPSYVPVRYQVAFHNSQFNGPGSANPVFSATVQVCLLPSRLPCPHHCHSKTLRIIRIHRRARKRRGTGCGARVPAAAALAVLRLEPAAPAACFGCGGGGRLRGRRGRRRRSTAVVVAGRAGGGHELADGLQAWEEARGDRRDGNLRAEAPGPDLVWHGLDGVVAGGT